MLYTCTISYSLGHARNSSLVPPNYIIDKSNTIADEVIFDENSLDTSNQLERFRQENLSLKKKINQLERYVQLNNQT